MCTLRNLTVSKLLAGVISVMTSKNKEDYKMSKWVRG